MLLSSSAPRVRFAIPGERADEFPIGSEVRVAVKPDGKSGIAVVERLAPHIDPESGLVFAEARITDRELAETRPGSIAATSGEKKIKPPQDLERTLLVY